MIRVASTEGRNVNLTININNQPKSTGRVNNRPPSGRPSGRRNTRPPSGRPNQRPPSQKQGNQREQRSRQEPAPVSTPPNSQQTPLSRGQKIHRRNLRISLGMMQMELEKEQQFLGNMGTGGHTNQARKASTKKIASLQAGITKAQEEMQAYGGVA